MEGAAGFSIPVHALPQSRALLPPTEAGLQDEGSGASNLFRKWSQETFMVEWETEAGKGRQPMCNVLSSHFLLGATEALGSSERQCGLCTSKLFYWSGEGYGHLSISSCQGLVNGCSFSFPGTTGLSHTRAETPGIRESPQMEEACRDWRLVKLTGKGPGQWFSTGEPLELLKHATPLDLVKDTELFSDCQMKKKRQQPAQQ